MGPSAFLRLAEYLFHAGEGIYGEWGSGSSTLFAGWFNQRLQIHSVDHDRGYVDRVRWAWEAMVAGKLIENGHRLVQYFAEGPKDYAAALDGREYDVLLVDGKSKYRKLCVERGYELLKPGGVLVLDNPEEVESFDWPGEVIGYYEVTDGRRDSAQWIGRK